MDRFKRLRSNFGTDIQPEAPKGERVLAWAVLSDSAGAVVMCTDKALHLPRDLAAGFQRIRWDQIHRASWDEPVIELVVDPSAMNPDASAGGKRGTAKRTIRVVVDEPGSVPLVVRDRVTASIENESRVSLLTSDGQTGWADVVARRNADSGDLVWSVVFAPGMDAADPQLQEAARTALGELRSALGI